MANVLIVEDDKKYREILAETLTQEGFTVLVAENGEEGIILAGKEEIDLILLDILMPKKSGFDVLRFMKSDKKLEHIPVVLLTNLSGAGEAKKGLDLGAIEYLVKSNFTPKEIVDKIKEISANSHNKKE